VAVSSTEAAGRRHRRWIHTERVPTAWQGLGAAARRQETVEANPDEALRQYVQAEAAEEFLSAERHQADSTPVAVVLHRNVTWSSVTATRRWLEIATRWV
jgi:hypothetical protein